MRLDCDFKRTKNLQFTRYNKLRGNAKEDRGLIHLAHDLIARSNMREIATKQREAESSTTTLPTRVIDIGFNSSQPLRLVNTAGESGIYAALSYSWDGPRPVAVKSNIRKLQESLERSEIGESVLAAIEVVRKLGIRYLWADFLCIIHDDEEDRLDTLFQISDIYSSATITICDTGEGTREYDANSAIVLEPLSIWLNWSQPTSASDHAKCLQTPSWSGASRGWTHQELELCVDFLRSYTDLCQALVGMVHENKEASRSVESNPSKHETEQAQEVLADTVSKPATEIEHIPFKEAVRKLEEGTQNVEAGKFLEALASFTAAKELVSTFKTWSLRSWKIYSIASTNFALVYLMQDLPTTALEMIDAVFTSRKNTPDAGFNCWLEYLFFDHSLYDAS